MGNTLQQLGSAIALSVALAGAPNTASAQSTQVAGQAQEKVEILLAQASAEKREYVVYVRQVDANGNLTDKKIEVRYTKNEQGVIIPPDTKGGKLLDGRDSTGDAVRDRATNRQIIGRYDKGKQIMLAMADEGDIIGDAKRKMETFTKKVENNESISKDDIFNMYYAIYIFSNANPDDTDGKTKKAINATEIMAKKMNMSSQEIEQIKQKAKEEAKRRWQSVTLSLE